MAARYLKGLGLKTPPIDCVLERVDVICGSDQGVAVRIIDKSKEDTNRPAELRLRCATGKSP